ncbi:endoplasmic oxidoreductin [Atractiella rhizophila]|nr:endoplasmic oxidoreductin [Atractiella rhizophila]
MRLLLLLLIQLARASLSQLEKPRADFFQTVLTTADQEHCRPSGRIQDSCCDFESVEDVNRRLRDKLQEIIQLPFFRYHKVDLYRDCPFWDDDGSCMMRDCAVETKEEDEIPPNWRWKALSEIETTEHEEQARQILADGCFVRDSDFCVLEDEQVSNGLYVDLLSNPERFTGYSGPSANKIWKSIYEENCFDPVPFMDSSKTFVSSSDIRNLKVWDETTSLNFGSFISGVAAPRDPPDQDTCLEKRVYYRLISGLHASISMHICSEYLNQKTGDWGPNLECFITRIAQHPERLQNIYFDYTKSSLESLVSIANTCPNTFDEKSMFAGPEAEVLKEEFKMHFRNVSQIMDCVGCDKCRLWGRLQVTGLATALKLLFSFDDDPTSASRDFSSSFSQTARPTLSRAEVVAFVWTLNRFSESLDAVEKFREMWASMGEVERERTEKSVQSGGKMDEDEEEDDGTEVEDWKDRRQRRYEQQREAAEYMRIRGSQFLFDPPEQQKKPNVFIRQRAGNSSEVEDEGLLRSLVQLCVEGWKSCWALILGDRREKEEL